VATRAIKRKRDEGPLAHDFQAPAETAPSVVRAEEPTIARAVAIVALFAAALGGFAFLLMSRGFRPFIGPAGATFCLAVGIAGLLFHAALERDLQLRRVYGILGAALLAAGIALRLLPLAGSIGGLFLPAGVPCLGLALAFLMAFTRNETDAFLLFLSERAIGLVGALLVLVGALGGLVNGDWLLTQGVVMMLLGLFYVAAYMGIQPAGSQRGYWAGVALGVLGGLMMVIALGYWLRNVVFLLAFFDFVNWPAGQPGPPFVYLYAGLEFVLLSVLACSDSRLAAMTRRELGAYFYSPIAYVVLVAVALAGGLQFLRFLVILTQAPNVISPFGMPEPIVLRFVLDFVPVIAVVCVVPIVTMRLLSEEQRTGTLEVLLTAPVSEWSVVLSKFFAALRFYLLLWYPWGLYLIALRVESGESFDYRPLLSFALALLITGAHFVAMGLFFSSLTRNQIAAAILTLLGMLVLLLMFFLRAFVQPEGAWYTVLGYVSYLDLWWQALRGNVVPRLYVFHLSAAIFWLFLTVRVLEARRWR
jgi:ABC-2 type transport system permease protein